MKKQSLSLLSILLAILLLTACSGKTEVATLTTEDATGYNLQEYLGQPMNDVLEALTKGGAETQPSDAEEYVNRDNLEVYVLSNTLYGHETTSELFFTSFGNPKEMRLMSATNTYLQTGWPDPDAEISQDIVKLYAALLDTYGEPTSKATTLQDPDAIMDNFAERWANWDIDDGDVQVSFGINNGISDEYCQVSIGYIYQDGANAYRENQ